MYPVVKPITLAIALPDNRALDEDTLVARIEHQMFDAVALFRCPTDFTHTPASLWIGTAARVCKSACRTSIVARPASVRCAPQNTSQIATIIVSGCRIRHGYPMLAGLPP